MTLLAEPVALNYADTYRQLPEMFYSPVPVSPPSGSFLIHYNRELGAEIGLPADLSPSQLTRWFTGAERLPDAGEPLSTVYAGHQFGSFVPQLGDGRAHLLGQIQGRDGALWEIQLKGSGQTPYSRFGDGRAVLRSSIREYLCSEAMAGLGIPTTRALCLTGSEEDVFRERIEKAAMVTRVAPSFVRFGHFEYFQHTLEDAGAVRKLADYVVDTYFPELARTPNRYAAWFGEIVQRTVRLMANWQAVGFAHGVMNTDNMSILGLTLDYGPFGFLDRFDPGYICNHSDYGGRYAFDQQPGIGLWNLHALGYALSSLVTEGDKKSALETYWPVFIGHYRGLMARKLGLASEAEEDVALISDLLALLAHLQADYTRFFRAMSVPVMPDADALDCYQSPPEALYREQMRQWLSRYAERLAKETADAQERAAHMRAVNPKYILRNYLAERAIRLAEDEQDFSEIGRLMVLLRHPFDEQPEMEQYAALPPDWANEICISCSS